MILNSLLLMKEETDLNQVILARTCIAVTIIAAIAILCMMIRFNRKNAGDFKRNLFVNLFTILTIVFLAVTCYSYTHGENLSSYKFTSLTEIKDSITVEDDKVKIAPLTQLQQKYKYIHDQPELREDETQIFKLEENSFYEKRWLVDQYGRRYQLDAEEYKMLKEKVDVTGTNAKLYDTVRTLR